MTDLALDLFDIACGFADFITLALFVLSVAAQETD